MKELLSFPCIKSDEINRPVSHLFFIIIIDDCLNTTDIAPILAKCEWKTMQITSTRPTIRWDQSTLFLIHLKVEH